MSDTHIHRNIDTAALLTGRLPFEDQTNLGGYDERFLPFVIASALQGKACKELRAIYRDSRNSLRTDSFKDESDRNDALAYHVKAKVEAIREMGFYRGLRRFDDAVMMTSLAVVEAYRELVVRSFSQTDETKNWGGWEGTFSWDHAAAVEWLRGQLEAFAA